VTNRNRIAALRRQQALAVRGHSLRLLAAKRSIDPGEARA